MRGCWWNSCEKCCEGWGRLHDGYLLCDDSDDESSEKEVEELQVELYGDWTYQQAEAWREMGIKQAIYHQSRDALLSGETWGEKDLSKVKKLIEMGFNVSVTGGLDVDTLKLFEGIDVYTFITGRGITAAPNPVQAAQNFKDEIIRIWGQ